LKATEVANIEQALASVSDTIRFIYVVVTKKSNVELYAQGFYTDSFKNIVPGTVVDSFVTAPKSEFMLNEFYLVSTTQKHGFPTPTRYQILHDTVGETSDKLHLLSYKLCHTYFNIPQAIKVPAPLLFAHKVSKQVAQRSLINEEILADLGRQYEPLVVHPKFRSVTPGLYFL
jgi:aubergine